MTGERQLKQAKLHQRSIKEGFKKCRKNHCTNKFRNNTIPLFSKTIFISAALAS